MSATGNHFETQRGAAEDAEFRGVLRKKLGGPSPRIVAPGPEELAVLRATPRLRAAFSIAACGMLVFATAMGASAQQQSVGAVEARMRTYQADAAKAKREVDSLQQVLRHLESSVRDMSAEAKNLEQQTDAAARIVNAYDRQLHALDEEVDSLSGSLVSREDELLMKQAALRRRLIDIYKRGPLYSFEALLSAESFGELIARYKYLHTIAERDRALVHRTEQLRDTVAGRHALLLVMQTDKEVSLSQKAEEEKRLRVLEQQWEQKLASTQRNRDAAQLRLQRAAATEKRFNDLMASLVADNRRTDARPNTNQPASRSLGPSERNSLDWPVDGDVIFSFGRLLNPNNTVIRWNGIGIAAPFGTPVTAIADGEVQVATSMATYGNTIIIHHGGGYSSYGYLSRMLVAKGEHVTKGQKIGEVGSDPDLGPHLYLQIMDTDGRAVDPMEWLRSKQ